jgi:serine/threonine protein kinase/tetratricopeptide (TPR) repeat protein
MSTFDSKRWLRVSRHLDDVLDLAPHERPASIAALRERDPDIATDVEAMLDQHRQLSDEGFLDTAPPKPVDASLTGVTVGAYTLTAAIGHGGMGSVWMAFRSDGRFDSRVAVKLLNAALVGRGGEERFRREGTILGRLAHPNIARLIDAGVSNTGQPYLVLELVEGRHLDTYCDEERLSVEQRIRLFLEVLSAVAHAHANLIVHRDLKPSNVLVTDSGQVKLLDFSIAKLMADEEFLSRLTRDGGAVLTPKYAAPEQVSGGPITTATDVYALGVLLYELLSGLHPLGSGPKHPVEFTRALVDSEPLRLSTAVRNASSTELFERLADRRRTTTDRLTRTLGGDLETILGKALKKEPEERYRSVVEFADDLRRHIEHQPISARPDTIGYRTRKFARRHWQGLTATVAAVVLITSLTGFYTWQLLEERDRARVQAEKASRISEMLMTVLTSADPFRDPGAAEPTVRNLLDAGAARVAAELGDQPELQAEMLSVIGRTYERIGAYDKALPLLEQALSIGRRTLGSEHVTVAQSLNNLGVLHHDMGNYAAAEPLLRESLAIRRRLLGNRDKDVAVTLVYLGRLLRDAGRSDEAEAPIRESLAIRQAFFGDEHRETATSKNDLAILLRDRGDLEGAEPLFRQNVATTERLLGRDHPNAAAAKGNLGLLLTAKGDAVGGEALLRETVRIRRQTLGERHTDYGNALRNLAFALEVQRKLPEAEALLQETVRIAETQLGVEHPRMVDAALDLARVQGARGRAAGTEATLRRALEVRERLYPAGDWRIGQAQSLLGASLLAERRYAEAEPLMLAADKSLKPVAGRQGREREDNLARLATLHARQGDAARR